MWYQNLRTNAPPVFAEHLAVQTLGHALGRNSINEIQPRAVHHNIYLSLLGKSGKSKKSTAQEDIMMPLYPPKYKGSAHFSPEGLLRKLGEQPQLICPLGEFSSFLRGIRKGNYMETFKEISNELFTCPPAFEKTLGNVEKSYYVKEPYLSLNTTCTLEEFKDNIDLPMLHGGFLPRWINIYAMPKYRKRGPLPKGVDKIERYLKDIVHRLYVECEKKPLKFTMTDDAYDAYDKICQDLEENGKWQDIQAYVARMNNYIIAYADILWVSDFIGEKVLGLEGLTKLTKLIKLIKLMDSNINLNAIKGINYINSVNSINPALIERAWAMLKPHLEYVQYLISDIEEDRFVSKVIHTFEVNNAKILTWSKCLQYSHLNSRDFKTAIDTLVGREQLDIIMKDKIRYVKYKDKLR